MRSQHGVIVRSGRIDDPWVLRTVPAIVIVEGAPDLTERRVSGIDAHKECIV